jgi:hypothetical protein
MIYFTQILHSFIFSLHAAFVSIHGPPWFHFEPPQLLNFVFDAYPGPGPAFDFDADPAFQYDANPDPASQYYPNPCLE